MHLSKSKLRTPHHAVIVRGQRLQLLNTARETWPDQGKRIQKQYTEKAKVIRKPTADCCCRRHHSLSGRADEFPIAPSVGELLGWPRYIIAHSTPKLFQPKKMCILVTGRVGEGMGKGALPARFHIHSSKNKRKYTIRFPFSCCTTVVKLLPHQYPRLPNSFLFYLIWHLTPRNLFVE